MRTKIEKSLRKSKKKYRNFWKNEEGEWNFADPLLWGWLSPWNSHLKVWSNLRNISILCRNCRNEYFTCSVNPMCSPEPSAFLLAHIDTFHRSLPFTCWSRLPTVTRISPLMSVKAPPYTNVLMKSLTSWTGTSLKEKKSKRIDIESSRVLD